MRAGRRFPLGRRPLGGAGGASSFSISCITRYLVAVLVGKPGANDAHEGFGRAGQQQRCHRSHAQGQSRTSHVVKMQDAGAGPEMAGGKNRLASAAPSSAYLAHTWHQLTGR